MRMATTLPIGRGSLVGAALCALAACSSSPTREAAGDVDVAPAPLDSAAARADSAAARADTAAMPAMPADTAAMPAMPAMPADTAAAAGGASGLLATLQSAVPGLSAQQTSLATGALLALARAKLPPDQFARVTAALPGSNELLGEAARAGLPSDLTDRSSLTQTLSQSGITPSMLDQLVPALGSAVARSGGQDLANTLLAALR
jgi:hypothetical protein